MKNKVDDISVDAEMAEFINSEVLEPIERRTASSAGPPAGVDEGLDCENEIGRDIDDDALIEELLSEW